MHYILLAVTAVAAVFPRPAPALEREGVVFAERVEVDGHTLQLNGTGLRRKTIFEVRVYVAALYVKVPSSDDKALLDAKGPKRLDIVFLRDVEAKDIENSWDEGLEKNCRENCERFADSLRDLKAAMIDVKKGARAMFVFHDDRIVVKLDGGEMRTFPGAEFSRLILSNFIGEPPTEALKEGLLGKIDPPPDRRVPAFVKPP